MRNLGVIIGLACFLFCGYLAVSKGYMPYQRAATRAVVVPKEDTLGQVARDLGEARSLLAQVQTKCAGNVSLIQSYERDENELAGQLRVLGVRSSVDLRNNSKAQAIAEEAGRLSRRRRAATADAKALDAQVFSLAQMVRELERNQRESQLRGEPADLTPYQRFLDRRESTAADGGDPSDLLAADNVVDALLARTVVQRAATTARAVTCDSLDQFKSLRFFNPDGNAAMYYAQANGNSIELFDGAGIHPTWGTELKPVTEAIVSRVRAMAENRDTLRSARVAAEHRTPEAPADPLAAVARAPDGTYEPKGPQLAQLRYYLVGKSVRVAGIIESLSPVGDGKGETGVVTSDRAAHLMFAWDACPDELRDDFKWRSINDTAFKKGSVVSMVGTVTRIDGDLVIVKPSSVRRTAP